MSTHQPVHQHKLKNGLNLIIIENHKSPIISTQVWVKSGSGNERLGQEGLSHFIEHLVFKTTKALQNAEVSSIIENCGGYLNAYTWVDQTVFYMTTPSSKYEKSLFCLSQMIGSPLFLKRDVDTEREVVLEEIRQGQDSLFRVQFQKIFSELFPKHPYSIPVIGYSENITKWSLKEIKNFFKKQYSPKNMTLIISGKVNPEKALQLSKKYFLKIKDEGKPVQRIPNIEKKPASNRLHLTHYEFTTSTFRMCWQGPKYKDADEGALLVLEHILSGSTNSRLTRDLEVKEALTLSTDFGGFSMQKAGFLDFSAEGVEKNFPKVFSIFKKHIKDILKGNISEEELRLAKERIILNQTHKLETADQLANTAAKFKIFYDDLSAQDNFFVKVQNTSSLDIAKIAAKWLHPQNTHFFLFLNKSSKKKSKSNLSWLQKIQKEYKETYDDILKEGPNKNRKVPTPIPVPNINKSSVLKHKKLTLSNGLSVRLIKEKSLPIVRAYLGSRGGVLMEGKSGLSNLSAQVWTFNNDQFQSESSYLDYLDKNHLYIEGFSGLQSLGLKSNAHKNHEEKLIDTFITTWDNPKITQTTLDRERIKIIEDLSTQQDHPYRVLFNGLRKKMFRGSPYSNNPMGTKTSLNSITKKSVIDFLSIATPKTSNVCLIGDFQENRWLDALEQIKKKGPNHRWPKSTTNTFHHDKFIHKMHKQQTHIAMCFPRPGFLHKKDLHFSVIETLLGGMSGPLFLNLREKQGLAYSVFPINFSGWNTGYIGGAISCHPEKLDQAIHSFQIEFKKLAQTTLSKKQIKTTVQKMIGGWQMQHQKNQDIAMLHLLRDLYGEKQITFKDYQKSLLSITPEDIQLMCKKTFLSTPAAGLVGDGKLSKI